MLKTIGGFVVYGLAVYGACVLLDQQRRIRVVMRWRKHGPASSGETSATQKTTEPEPDVDGKTDEAISGIDD